MKLNKVRKYEKDKLSHLWGLVMRKYLKIRKLGNMFYFLDCSVYNSKNIRVYEIKEENNSFFRRVFHFF
jgi:hypothetical protein